MKYLALPLSILFVTLLATGEVLAVDGLLAHYQFEEPNNLGKDSTINNNHGSVFTEAGNEI